MLPSEIQYQICQVYGDNAMSDGIVRKWVRICNERRENVHDEARSGRPSLVNDDLVRKVNETFGAKWLSPLPTPKELLGGKQCDDDDDLKDAVQKWLTSQAAAFYEEAIQKLVPRHYKCLSNGGEYVKK